MPDHGDDRVTPSPGDPRHVFVVGVQRCGTTSLWHLLDEHPDITMAGPVRPEPKALLDPLVDDHGPEGYRTKWFPDADTPVLGEKATCYLDRPEALRRIAAHFPDALVVVSLRNPARRALSHYRFSTANGMEHRPPDALLDRRRAAHMAWDPSTAAQDPYDYLGRGRYLAALERLWTYVSPARTHVVIHEEMVEGPGPIHELYRALGVAPFTPPSLGRVTNATEPPAGPEDRRILRELARHYDDPNRLLAARLDRPLPW